MSNYWNRRNYSEASTSAGDLARRGLVYVYSEQFAVASTGSVAFNLETNGLPVEIRFYEFSNDGEPIYAEMIENATKTVYGSAIQARNLNREYTDTTASVMKAASGVSGGTFVISEFFGSQKAAGSAGSEKIISLSESTDYTMIFTNLGNQESDVHMNLGIVENEPAAFSLVRENIT